MRVSSNEIMVGSIETDEIISKGNYGSKKGYSIYDLILEKTAIRLEHAKYGRNSS